MAAVMDSGQAKRPAFRRRLMRIDNPVPSPNYVEGLSTIRPEKNHGVKMRKAICIFLSILLLALSSMPAMGRSLRCGSRLVLIGDYQDDVARKCGDPEHIASYELYPDAWISKPYDYRDERYKAPYLLKGPIIREVWTYDFGPNRLPYYLHFDNGRLRHLETGRRR